MGRTQLYADILIPLPVHGTFTYSVPEALHRRAAKGKRCIVPFGKKKLYAGIINHLHTGAPAGVTIRDMIDILDEEPVVNELQLNFWNWISRYYMCTLGEVVHAALPAGLKLDSQTLVFINPQYDHHPSLSRDEQYLLDIIGRKSSLNIRQLANLSGDLNILATLKTLTDKRAVMLEEHIRESYKPKKEFCFTLASPFRDQKKLGLLLDSLKKAPKQEEVLSAFIHLAGIEEGKMDGEVNRQVLLSQVPTGGEALRALIRKKVLTAEQKIVTRLEESTNTVGLNRLNAPQEKAIAEIRDIFGMKDVALLHGVTSSGKTEIYIHLIDEQIAKGNQVLYLLPEIALTTQIIRRLRRFFGSTVGVYHSRFSDAERLETWKEVLRGTRVKLVIGARSAVFLPFSKLGLVIVDEEHENSYKQYDPAPRYHARDAAIYLASLHGAKVLLGTATPAIESYHNSLSGKYGLTELHERFLDIRLPEIIVTSTREAYRQKRMKSHFTPALLDQIQRALNRREQVILFQNRRGFAPYIECTSCNWIPRCRSCDVTLTYHHRPLRLICHHCGYATALPRECPSCGSTALATRGFGTEKIEQEIAFFFPGAHIARLDLDAARTRRQYEKILGEFESGKINILVGTQMVSKGLDFDNVGLVGILDADSMLNFPDFRAFERSYQLMAQVSGRAGRKNRQGTVIIQASDPDHWVIRNVKEYNYHNLYARQLDDRKKFNYPPFYRLMRITVRHRNREVVDRAATLLADRLKDLIRGFIVGPEYPLINRIRKLYQKEILVKIEKTGHNQNMKDLISDTITRMKQQAEFKSLQVIPDVDPM